MKEWGVDVLVVNPPVYDFTAFDFWLRPYGLLRVAGRLRTCQLTAFDYLVSHDRDSFGRGRFDRQLMGKPAAFSDIPRHFYRFGRPRAEFIELLQNKTFDVVLVQTVMTYWYLGVREVIEDVRHMQPHAKIILGGVYATLCPDHARSLGADQIVEGTNLAALDLPLSDGLPFWEGVDTEVGVVKITDGCPFRCTYCSVPIVHPAFAARPLDECCGRGSLPSTAGSPGHIAFFMMMRCYSNLERHHHCRSWNRCCATMCAFRCTRPMPPMPRFISRRLAETHGASWFQDVLASI
jgi:hypothetical protein